MSKFEYRQYPEFSRGICMYGQNHIVRCYVDWPEDLPLPLGMPYAFHLLEGEAQRSLLKNYWSYTPASIHAGTCHALGHPVLYIEEDTHRNDASRGTLAIPHHLYGEISDEYREQFRAYCRKLLALPDEYHPITICLHGSDQLLNSNINKEFGIGVITNGQPRNNFFLHNLCSAIKQYKFVITETSSVHSYLALLYGKQLSYLQMFPSDADASVFERLKSEDGATLAKKNLGVNFKKSKRELRDLLDHLATLDNYRLLLRLRDKFGATFCDFLSSANALD